MKVPVLNTIPQIQNAIAELYRIVDKLQQAEPKEVIVTPEVQPVRRGRPPKSEVENQEG